MSGGDIEFPPKLGGDLWGGHFFRWGGYSASPSPPIGGEIKNYAHNVINSSIQTHNSTPDLFSSGKIEEEVAEPDRFVYSSLVLFSL